MTYLGDMTLGSTINFKFTTVGTSGVPTNLAATTSTTISIYPGNSSTQLTAGATLTTDFDGIVGLNAVSIALTGGNGYAVATDYSVVLATGTVGGTNILGYVVGDFSVQNRNTILAPQSINSASFSAGAITSTTFTTGAIGGTTFIANAIGATTFASGAIVATTFAAGAITSTVIAAGAITSTTFTTGAIAATTFIAGSITSTVLAAGAIHSTIFTTGAIAATTFIASAINSTVIADAAIDRATFAADTGLQPARSNTAQAGGATSITLDAGASATADFYKNDLVYLTGGTGIGQARFITAYNGTTKVATVSAWATNPDNTSGFAILPDDAGSFSLGVGAINSSTFSAGAITSTTFTTGAIAATTFVSGAITSTVIDAGAITSTTFTTGAITATTFVAGAITSTVIAANALTSSTIATNAITSATLDSSATGDIADALLGRNVAGGSSSGRLVKEALYFLRNKWTVNAGTLTVYGTDDSTSSWVATVGTDAAADPIVSNDPA